MDQALAPGADRVGDWMMTYSGIRFWPLDPRAEEVNFRDIGHALGMICRYGGHVKRFYSVAEHSVLLSRYFSEVAGDRDLARYALLHDGTEAYIGDMIRPLKYCVPQYREIEAHLERVILTAAGLKPEMPAAVKDADTRIIVDEALALFRPEALEQSDWVFRTERLNVDVYEQQGDPFESELLWATAFGTLFPEIVLP